MTRFDWFAVILSEAKNLCQRSFVASLLRMTVVVLFCSIAFAADRPTAEDLSGERMVYDIREFGMKVGEASLIFEGPVEHDGRKVLLIHSWWKVFGVTNDERVYMDPQTLDTLEVTKDRVKFFCKIDIHETYSPKEGKVTIDRDTCGKDSQKVIRKNAPVENIYAAIYRLRMQYALHERRPFPVHLFDRDVNFKFRGLTMLKIFRRKYPTYHFDGERFAIWLDQSPERVPLRFDSDVEGHRVTMIMKERKIAKAR